MLFCTSVATSSSSSTEQSNQVGALQCTSFDATAAAKKRSLTFRDIVGNELHSCACVFLPSPVAGVHQPPHEEERQDEQEEVRSAPFSGLSSGEDIGSPRQQSFSDFSTPLTSPKLSSLDNSDEFGIGIGSPSSPPPFAVRNAKQTGAGAVSSPFRWENLAHESGYASPVLKSPRHGRHRVSHLHGPFGIDDETKSDASQSSINSSPNAVMSPRIVHGTQVQIFCT